MNQNSQVIIIIILGLSLISGWILTWINTIEMSEDSKIKPYYHKNLHASISIAVAIVLNLLINVSKLNRLYLCIPGLITLYGYYQLWSNTAKMQSDSNASKYYQTNKYASLLIGIPYGISILYLFWLLINNN